ncbi:hypothetical protein [Arcanobacterium hippocoleae]|uniref:Uncharacterized protein n=1 Tax=Arcanobacterium hippocoleae TaxID=149017 RepID=A0ABU1T1I2_9ACTO|nr:hypothetical protein [Arcanobacterium hippocoleae]MDR6939227.1 hypothetical protein [Arcanobacterium hippocoleae]
MPRRKTALTIADIDMKIENGKKQLQSLVQQRQELIEKEKGLIAIASIFTEVFDCSYQDIGIEKLRTYLNDRYDEVKETVICN